MATRPAYVWTGSDFDEIGDKRLGPSVTALNSALASKQLISRSSSTPTRLGVGSNGQVLTANSATTTGLAWTTLATGKILQIVRATDSTDRSTTSTSYVDVTGMSVTITPQKSDSAILVLFIGLAEGRTTTSNDTGRISFRITDSSNNALSGAEEIETGYVLVTGTGTQQMFQLITPIGYSTPATTSATTYKVRFKAGTTKTAFLRNVFTTGQLYAIEVSA
jgi:hypothetical protein